MGNKMAIRGARLLSWGLSVPWMASPPALKAAADMCMEMIRLDSEHSPIDLSDFLALQAISKHDIVTLDPDLDFEPRAVQADRGSTPEWGKQTGTQVVNRTAIIPIQGMIYRYADMFTMMCGGTTTQNLSQAIRSAQNDSSIDSIILEIDSPGGEADGISELAYQIRATNEKKPVIAHGDGDVASAAYYLAAAAGKVVVSPSSLVGCIGTIGMIPNPDLETGPKATIPLVSKQSPKKYIDTKTEEGRAQLQVWIDDLGQVFINDVANFRGTTPGNVEENYGQGDCLIAAKALKAGMVDSVGGLDDVLAELAAGRETDRPVQSKSGGRTMPKGSFLDKLRSLMQVAEENPDFNDLLEEALTPQMAAPGLPVHNPPPPVAQLPPISQSAGIPEEPATPVEQTEEYKALQAKLAKYEEQEKEHQRTQRVQKAEEWAKGIVLSGKAFPAEQKLLAQAYLNASEDDEARGPFTMADSTLETRVSRLEALIEARPGRDHEGEAVPVVAEGTELRIVENLTVSHVEEDDDLSEEEKVRYLSMTPAGKKALERRKKAQ